ncbi:Splicing factor arginine/serine-rich 6 [Operophtera brumata]|uniref:Splicing factor arginine/serine-rich 6 n=1 Tax=Operophtera brumata TaxID=104452 RepID=A0A0L7L365_OPEBR|nr:Splicing factor arginine/serine-rich 6 [Operophtera brumata]
MVGSRVYVGGLPFGVRDRDLDKFFKGFGRIRDILIKNGYGFVSMKGSRVYVGGLPHGVRDRDLEKFFKGLGRISDVLIKNGYGFVEFEDYRDADDAVYELNGKELLGERVVVEPARGIDRSADRYRRERPSDRDRGRSRYDNGLNYRYGPPTRTEYRLTVENLSSRISWQDLKDYMRQAGEVTYADAHKQHRNEGI